MDSVEFDPYQGREQTKVKHVLLRHYLDRFAHIIGSRWPSITFVDCFSGPWDSRTPDHSDTSFSIARQCFSEAREHYKERFGKELRLRFLFLEKDEDAFAKLQVYAATIQDAEVKLVNGEFEKSVPQIMEFVRRDAETFPFVFIDPTGWTGFPLASLRPLLTLRPVEILINHMTGHIQRFVEDPKDIGLRKSFIEMHGDENELVQIKELARKVGIEDASVIRYGEVVRREGSFKHIARANVLYGDKNRTYFNLVYATRADAGLEAFKGAERKSMEVMESQRLEVQRQKRAGKNQEEFQFAPEFDPDYSEHFAALRERHLETSQKAVLDCVRSARLVSYDQLWGIALAQPLTWEADLKSCLGDWRKQGRIDYEKLPAGARVPKKGDGVLVRWIKD